MRNKLWIIMLVFILIVLAACGKDKADIADDQDGLVMIDVAFELPENVDVGETILLEATVTHRDELVKDADDVNFEYWEEGNKENSIKIDSINNGDGTYTAEVSLDHDGIFTMYAHVTARTMHTMPKRSVIVGEGTPFEAEHEDGEEHEPVEGFGMHFMEPEDVIVNDETELIVHLSMDDTAFKNADVRYEIWNDDISDKHDWVDAEELTAGEYSAVHIFAGSGTYMIQIHVEDDEGLHEHEEYQIVVGE